MTVSLKAIMRQLAKSVKEKERFNRELELAADIQKQALPHIPAAQKEVDIAADSIPAKEVGGDYFDFLLNDPGRIGFVIADAAGKGFPGSLYMTNSRSVFRVLSAQEPVPSNVLRQTNDFISAEGASTEGMFITFLYAVFDKTTKQFTYANAGHYPPLIYCPQEKKFRSSGVGGIPLGVYSHQEFPQETVQLQSDDVVVMYTDGVIEASNKEGKMFGLPRLATLIEDHAYETAKGLLECVESSVTDFMGSEPFFDDMTLVVVKIR
jgi:phosphoserine phosphatase RsbU/P